MEKNDNLRVSYKNIDEIIPYKNNPRKNDNAVEYVKNSIKDFGFKVPIVIDEDNIVVAGHTRLKAAKELNLDRIPCIVADDLTEEQIKAFRLADNKVSEFSKWDFDLLNSELDELDIDSELYGFFEDDEFDISYIDELNENGFSNTNGQNDYFAMSFNFPIEKEKEINDYVDEVSKEKIVEDIILKAEGLSNA